MGLGQISVYVVFYNILIWEIQVSVAGMVGGRLISENAALSVMYLYHKFSIMLGILN